MLSANSLDYPQSLTDQTLISGKKKCLVVCKKAQQTPYCKIQAVQRKKMLPEGSRLADELKTQHCRYMLFNKY